VQEVGKKDVGSIWLNGEEKGCKYTLQQHTIADEFGEKEGNNYSFILAN
jgi:hypothetical protein